MRSSRETVPEPTPTQRVLLRCADEMKEAARQASAALQLEAIPTAALTGSSAKVEAIVPSEPPLKARQRHSNRRRQGNRRPAACGRRSG